MESSNRIDGFQDILSHLLPHLECSQKSLSKADGARLKIDRITSEDHFLYFVEQLKQIMAQKLGGAWSQRGCANVICTSPGV